MWSISDDAPRVLLDSAMPEAWVSQLCGLNSPFSAGQCRSMDQTALAEPASPLLMFPLPYPFSITKSSGTDLLEIQSIMQKTLF